MLRLLFSLLGALLLLAPSPAAAQSPPLRTIMVNGTAVTVPWSVLNFTGTGVTYSNDALNKRMVINISGVSGSTSQNYLFAGPTSGSGTPSFRSLVLGDLPGTVKSRPYFDIRDYGAVAGSDVAPAVQAAFDAACAAGTGTVVMPSRDSSGAAVVWLWQSAVSVNCAPGGIGPFPILNLQGPSTVLVTAGSGAPYVALTVSNASRFTVEGIKFYGTRDTAHPTTAPNPLSGVISATKVRVLRCEFNGIMLDRPVGPLCLFPDNAVVFGQDVEVDDVVFAAVGGSCQAVVRAKDYVNLSVRNTYFIDFFTLDNVNMIPASGDYVYSSIVALDPDSTTDVSHFGASRVLIDNVRIDEGTGGGGEQVIIANTFPVSGRPPVPYVQVNAVQEMVGPSASTTGLRIEGAKKVHVRDWLVYHGSVSSTALLLRNVDEATIQGTYTIASGGSITKVDADSSVGVLRLIDSHLSASGVTAVQIIQEKSAWPFNLFNFTNATRPAANAVRPGALIWNTQTSQVQVSDGANWLIVGP